ncbi:HNH endonuclease [Streptomyces sp. NPDC050546]|uniref:HNH endonuclease n=1 Tax=Streptomyces sp. NPDC050546 TaxID=3365628 RepID=UPI0037B15589
MIQLRVGFGRQFVYGGVQRSSGEDFEGPAALLATGLVVPADGDWRGIAPGAPTKPPEAPTEPPSVHEPCDPGPKPAKHRGAMQVCPVAGCPCLTWSGKCPAHARSNSRGQRYRDSYAATNSRLTRWSHLSRAFLRAHQTCESAECAAIPAPLRPAATETDHIDGLGLQGPRWDDPANWQALCKPCHSRKTASESFGR